MGAAVLVVSLATIAVSTGVASADVSPTSMFLYGIGHTGYAADDTTIDAASAPTLALAWSTHRDWSTNQPVESDGDVYWSTWDGILHATNVATQQDDWTYDLGTTPSPCGGTTGPDSTATVMTSEGTPTVFIGGGTGQVVALDATTGQLRWQTQLSTDPAGFVWSSPTYYQGSIYIGLASAASCPDERGELFKLDAADGSVQATFFTVPEGCRGGDVWSSPTIDAATGELYIGTGNVEDAADIDAGADPSCATEAAEPHAQALLELNTSDLSLQGSYQPPDNFGDADFGATPTLFDATVAGVDTPMVGLVNKNGIFYAFDRADISAGPVWTYDVGIPGTTGPGNAEYSSSATYDGTSLYVGGDVGQVNGQTCPGTLSALDPATGRARWQLCLPSRILGAVTSASGIVEANAGDTAMVLDSTTGTTLFSYTDPDDNLFWGPAYIGDGVLYVSNNDGNLFAFTVGPAADAPEVPYVTSLPLAGATVIGITLWRRRGTRAPASVG